MMISGPPEPETPVEAAALPTCEGSDELPQPDRPESMSGRAIQLTSRAEGTMRPARIGSFEGFSSLIGSRVSRRVGFEVVNVGTFGK
jgi:hypothetical protein